MQYLTLSAISGDWHCIAHKLNSVWRIITFLVPADLMVKSPMVSMPTHFHAAELCFTRGLRQIINIHLPTLSAMTLSLPCSRDRQRTAVSSFLFGLPRLLFPSK